jgi:hypothetical protein
MRYDKGSSGRTGSMLLVLGGALLSLVVLYWVVERLIDRVERIGSVRDTRRPRRQTKQDV